MYYPMEMEIGGNLHTAWRMKLECERCEYRELLKQLIGSGSISE